MTIIITGITTTTHHHNIDLNKHLFLFGRADDDADDDDDDDGDDTEAYNYRTGSEREEGDVSALSRTSPRLSAEFNWSSLEPVTMVESERPGRDIEKLLLERTMARKDLRLRVVQERLAEKSQRLVEAEARLSELERLPGLKMFVCLSGSIQVVFSWLYKVEECLISSHLINCVMEDGCENVNQGRVNLINV